QERGHPEEENRWPDANRFARKQAQERAGRDRDSALNDERGRRTEEDRQRPMARRQQERGQRRLVGQLEQEDDGEDREPETQRVRHWGGSLSADRVVAQWSQSGKERTKTSRPRPRVRRLILPAPSVLARRGS